LKKEIKKGKPLFVFVSLEQPKGSSHTILNFTLHSKGSLGIKRVGMDKGKKLLTDLVARHSSE
jgi:hypothetical protein